MQIKYVQWEKLRQTNFQDGDQFFQKFKELAYDMGVQDNEQVMLTQVKKAARESSKNTIYAANRDVPTKYDDWKKCLLHINYNYHLKRAEGNLTGRTDTKPPGQKTVMSQKGGQAPAAMPEKKTGTSMTYGGRGTLMDIDRKITEGLCFLCGKPGHMKCDCPNRPKMREEAMHRLNAYWDMQPTVEEPTGSKVEEVKDKAGK